MIDVMQSGSVIYDLAASQGGNSELTKVNEIIDHNGVKIMGDSNILNKLPNSASNLYAKNMFNFVSNLYDKENKKININLEDEIIEKTQIKQLWKQILLYSDLVFLYCQFLLVITLFGV